MADVHKLGQNLQISLHVSDVTQWLPLLVLLLAVSGIFNRGFVVVGCLIWDAICKVDQVTATISGTSFCIMNVLISLASNHSELCLMASCLW